jgi:hypothetical protein
MRRRVAQKGLALVALSLRRCSIFSAFLPEKICWGGGGSILGFLWVFLRGLWEKWSDVDGFLRCSCGVFVVKLWFLAWCFWELKKCHFFKIYFLGFLKREAAPGLSGAAFRLR